VLLEDYPQAIEALRRARAVVVPGTIWPVLVDFWGGLALAGIAETATGPRPENDRAVLLAAQTSLQELAENCPENYRCFWLLLSAAASRLESRHADETRFCEEALIYARQTRNLQHEALANELCARSWLSRDREGIAAEYLREARRGYAEWGATVKAAQLDARYGDLLPATPPDPIAVPVAKPAATGPEPGELDMSTVLKVARAIAVEIEFDGLLRKLMRLALENAGANRGVFLQERDGALYLEAEAVADGGQVTVGSRRPLEQADDLPHSIVRYVQRTGQDVVDGNAAADERFAGDRHISRARSKSILCVPVGHQGRPGGILYLENTLATEAFTPDRIEIMRILAAQTAISLENARLYEDMKGEVGRRTAAEQALRQAMTELEGLKNRLEAENVYLQEEIRTQHNFNEIVGNSPALLDSLHRVARVAPTDSTVLILGETGCGKELFARAVHSRSKRSHRPLVKVNCGAIAPGLVESELFGHVKGAFTGAIDKRVGRFEVADGGTIFLDEVGELPLEAQVKLLRVLQEHEFEPVGSSRTIRVSVRVITATNRDLEQAVRDGKFRADLLYRLNVFPIEIPPLRDRKDDIRLLVNFLTAGLSRKLGKPIHGFSPGSMDRLVNYGWPGNVRELQNVVERAAILSQGPVLELEESLPEMEPRVGGRPAAPPQRPGTLDDAQRAHILDTLRATGGVVEGTAGAASILGMHPNTLRSRMKKLGISPVVPNS
jgi:transcriptional regulator with GAF, ATPase, and Fis domain